MCSALNPARDLGPRIMHSLLSYLPNKGDDDWVTRIPVVIQLLAGAVIAVAVFGMF